MTDRASTAQKSTARTKPVARKTIFELVVACQDERQQRELFERLAREGWKCRVITA